MSTSTTTADAIDDYRDTPADRLKKHFSARNGVQPGDPPRSFMLIH